MHRVIPKRLIQTGKQHAQPLLYRGMMTNLRLLHPDYEYMFFDNHDVDEFVKTEFPDYQEIFNSFPFPIQRYDFFRYLAVYRYGGFYFDLDVLLATEISELLSSGCVFPFETLTVNDYLRNVCSIDWEIGNYGFGACARHPFLRAVIDNCVRAQRDPNWVRPMMQGISPLLKTEYLILNTTGPGLLSRTLAENPELARTVTVLLPDNVCDTSNWHRFGTFGIHLMNGSWRPGGSFLRRRLAQQWEAWKQQRSLKQSLRHGGRRYHIGNTTAIATDLSGENVELNLQDRAG
jgi:hypothetical protein